MKSSIIRGVLIFAAGAGCATVAGGWWMPPETNPEEYGVLLQKTAHDVAVIGLYGDVDKYGLVSLTPNPAACTPTPQPDIMEGLAANPVLVYRGLRVIDSYNDARIAGVKTIVKIAPPCMPERTP
jgi:hypothetical protein